MLELYGLVVASDTELHQDRPAPPGAVPDVTIVRGAPTRATTELPPGETVLRAGGATQTVYAFTRHDNGFTLRFFGACDVHVSPALDRMEVRSVDGSDEGMASVLTTGASLAFQLYQRGHLVLHASAVEVGGSAWGFVGRSGMGKSTMAALLCGDGGALITDDVLRLDDVTDRPVARLGATELRLRKGADSLVARFDDGAPQVRRSADDREVLRLRDGAADRLPLDVLIIPFPSRTTDRVEVRRLRGPDAVLALSGFPRLIGWRDPEVLSRQLTLTAALAGRVPVIAASVPWGPPFAPTLVEQLTDRVRALLPSPAAH
ncbi:hypothetical protein SAMN05216184_103246 [Georgenia satyanarayanai]|uniref:Hpr(Ser) kinase/phosphatase n=1 Tax=Georgenia satyanarayanai TaxID=860221 RepID=A0A2Y9BX21_9MICO|nr:hypothetical protein [Georgenia satyanarayanai]PYG00673.1 hypothetical protein A8987_103246 [Georgenia satyanarayanai]SSA40062.1 hypothetical protein SAMN05216184_103246 [Georgenia satyanarayanai]